MNEAAPETKTFVCEGHAKNLLCQMHQLLTLEAFCDVCLSVESKVFKAHKNVLSAGSPYFRAMFCGGLIETSRDNIQLHNISPDVFQILLDFIYTGEICVTQDNCQDLLAAADMLELCEVTTVCCNFLKKQLHPSNCIGIMRLAEVHACTNLQTACEAYIHNHFLKVIQEEEYFDLTKETVIKLLQSENLCIEVEFQVFTAALNWLMHDVTQRRKYVFDVLAPVRFPIISQKQLEKHVSECEDLSLKVALRKLLQDFSRDQKMPYDLKVKRVKPYLLQPRKCARKNIFLIGGYSRDVGGRWSDSHSLSNVEQFDTFLQQWKSVSPVRHSRSGHGVVVLNGLIYTVGGESDSLIYDNAECYDPETNKWTMIPSMTVPRCGLGLCAFEDCIYAIGGWIGCEIGHSVEKYDLLTNVWSQVDKVNTLRFAAGVVQHQGLIYVIGGMSDLGTEMKTVEIYNPVIKLWTVLPPMSVKRAYVGVAVLENHVFAVGGWNEDSGALDSVERYSIEDNCWTDVPKMNFARAGASVAAVNGLLYVIGGRTSSDEFTAPSTLNSVECFDPQTESWFSVASMPTSRCEGGVAVL